MPITSASIAILRKDLFPIWILATGALCAGLLINQFRDHPLPLLYSSKQQRMEAAVSRLAVDPMIADFDLPQVTGLAEVAKFSKNKTGILLDARPNIFYRLGHIPGARSLSREEFEKDYRQHREFLESHREQPLVVYCSDTSCEDSGLVAAALLRLGYHRVLLYKGGWSEWTQNQMPEEK